MKRLIVLLGICFPFYMNALTDITLNRDTTIFLNNKKIEIQEDEDKMKVRVYELTGQDEYIETEKVFEGHYRDGQSYERRKQKTISIPVPSWKNSEFQGHWEGIGIGFANFADGSLHVNDIHGITLNSGKSMEYNLNLFSYGFRLGKNVGIVTGAGMRWNRYRIKGDQYFKEIDGVTGLLTLPEDYSMRSSKLNTTSITIPVLFAWQNGRTSYHELFFLLV
ncbi:MAG: PorT family protein [Tannerellaceae bacterium]|nr:PorT family protein [Tannerellaceae bacterium]